MIEFATLFLGLVVGAHNLEMVVGPGVERVEIRLDERKVAELRSGPWRTMVDFGRALEPHTLSAVAYDAGSRELGRAHQWINRPRAQAEAVIVLEGGANGRGRRAHVTWHSVTGPEPRKWSVTFDGKPLAVADPRTFELPPHVPEQVHFVRVELDFTGNIVAVAEAVFGGRSRDETLTELTAVPVVLAGARKLPDLPALQGLFTEGAGKLRVVAAEEGPAEVAMVVDMSADALLSRLEVSGAQPSPRGPMDSRRFEMRLAKEQRLRFVWPIPEEREHSGFHHEVFPVSEDLTPEDGGVLWLLNRVRRPALLEGQRLTEAIAVGAVSAAARNRRRAVVLILGDDPRDVSNLSTAEVRRYLDRVGVPLFVWSAVPPASHPPPVAWGHAADVSTRRLFERAVKEVSAHLKRQRIVWVEGAHLPQRVAVAGGSRFLALASSPQTPLPDLPSGETQEARAAGPAAAREGELLIPAGTRLRREPDERSPTLSVVDADMTLAVVERRGPWSMVRYGAWKGWVLPGGDGGAASLAHGGQDRAALPDPERLENLGRARAHLRPGFEVRELFAGRLVVLTDATSSPVIADIERVWRRLAPVYGERYGIPMGASAPWTVVVFASEEDYRAFAGPEPEGPGDPGFAVAFRGERGPEETRRELARSLTRHANHMKLMRLPPAWLDEGLAGDLALSEAPDGGASASRVREALGAKRLPSLSALAGSSRREFFAPDARELNAALAGLFVRYLVEGDGGAHAAAFRDFLDGVARGDLPGIEVLLQALRTNRDALQQDFEAWLGRLT